MKSKLITSFLGSSIIFCASAAQALPLNFWGYKSYEVKKVNPFFFPDIVVMEHNGEEAWFFLPDTAIQECSIDKGDKISAQLLPHDPVSGSANKAGSIILRNSDNISDRVLDLIMNNPLSDGIEERMIKNVFGCSWDLMKE